MNHPSKYLNSDMSPVFKPGSPAEIIGKQMDFLYEQGRKIAEENKEDTLCGKAHNNGDDRPQACNECMMIKEGI